MMTAAALPPVVRRSIGGAADTGSSRVRLTFRLSGKRIWEAYDGDKLRGIPARYR